MFGMFFAMLFGMGIAGIWHRRRHFTYGFAARSLMGRHGRHGGGMGRLMRELNVTPDQKTALRDTAGEVRQAFRNAKPWARLDPLLGALTADSFDRDRLMADMRESSDVESARSTIASAVERVRGILNPDQRRRLVEIVNRQRSGGSRC